MTKAEKKELYKKVAASLQYGSVFQESMAFWVALLCIAVLYLFSTGVYLIFTKVGSAVDDGTNSAIYANMAGFIMVAAILCVLVPRLRLKKKIFLWFDDAVLRHAKIKEVDSMTFRGAKSSKISVMFSYDDKKYKMISGEPAGKLAWLGSEGYNGTFTKYIDREVDILYSPKYNQVMLLKD